MSNIKLIQQEKVDYGRKIIVMGKGNDKNKDIKNTENNNTPSPPPLKKFYEHPLFIAICPALVAAIISIFFNIGSSTFLNQNDISHLNNRIDELAQLISSTKNDLQDDISDVSNDLKEYEKDINSKIEELNRVIGRLQGATGIVNNEITVNENGQFALLVKNTYQSDQSVYLSSGATLWNDNNEIIAENAYTDIVYTVEELENITIILHYTENGEDVFLKGQFDENGYWDGNCVINRYQDGNLTMIMDAIYNSGILFSYEQVFTYKKLSGYNVWAIAAREIDGDVKSGYTWTYYKYDNYVQDFSTEVAQSSDIINVEEFKSKVELFLEGYYSGYTSNGYYNDDTGNAYLIKYFEPGVIENAINPVIRTFYQGNFVDGQPDDDSYNSWHIARESNTSYMYYRGGFSNGNANSRNEQLEDFKNNLTHEQIDEYLNLYGFSEYSDQFVTEYENQ